MSESRDALKLKEEGNAFFVKKDFPSAVEKYNKAIELDKDNAVLYANRSACFTSLMKYAYAIDDARKAVDIDPSYAKAWARLANAQHQLKKYDEATQSWEKSIAVISAKTSPTQAETRSKQEYEACLCMTMNAKQGFDPIIMPASVKDDKKLPWDRANALSAELGAANCPESSGWVIKFANEEFLQGYDQIKSLKQVGDAIVGRPGALALLTNGILRDKRVFRIEDQDWSNIMNRHIRFEAMQTRAFPVADSAESILQSASERLANEGWAAVRPALATTIRQLFLQGFVLGGLSRDRRIQAESYAKTLEILDKGSKIWRNVGKDDRGAVFEPSFIRGMRAVHLEVLMEVYSETPHTKQTEVTLEEVFEEAEEIIKDAELHPPDLSGSGTVYDPGFVSSFWIYPKALAFTAKGFYHNEMAKFIAGADDCDEGTTSGDAMMEQIGKAADAYLRAAELYPEDDEWHAMFLNNHVEFLFHTGATLRKTMPVIARIRAAIPKMQRIWEHSASAMAGRDARLQRVLQFEVEIKQALAEGSVTLDEAILPGYLTSAGR